MAASFRCCTGLLLVAFLAMALMDTTVEARSYRSRHRVQRRDIAATDKVQDDDYLQGDGGYDGGYDDEFLNDADEGDGNEDGDDDDDDGAEDDGDSSENEKMEPVVITSKPMNFTASEHSTVWLPCNVLNSENAVIIWGKGDHLFYQGNIQTSKDPRIIKYTNHTLSISNMNSTDHGAYTCSVAGTSTPSSITHHVTMTTAPHIYHINPNGTDSLVVEGRPLKIQCLSSGHPTPTMTWSKAGHRLTKDDVAFGHQSIFIKQVRREDAGTYQCLASNGIGSVATGSVTIKILHAPEVHVKKSVVNTGEGYEAVLLCSVRSEPRATIIWERNGLTMKDTKHHPISLEDSDHSKLRIMKVTATDFGKYICKASNQYGESSAHTTLSRQPGRAIWIAGTQGPDDSSPVLQWAVESVQPLKDIEIRYFKVDETKPEHVAKDEEWIVVKPDIKEPNGNVYTVRHALQGLQPGKYAATLRSQNEHGWSEVSEQRLFDGDYESNEIRADESLQEAPVAEVFSGANFIQHSLFFTAATLLLSMFTNTLVRIY